MSMLASLQACQRRTDILSQSVRKMEATTSDAFRACELLTKRAEQLDSLTSPASDASSMLSRANANLTATLVLMKDAREKFDTVADCEPSIERLHRGVVEMDEAGGGSGANAQASSSSAAAAATAAQGAKSKVLTNRNPYTEQDVYAACDSMEILRDAYLYFGERKHWKSTAVALGGLERCHKLGLDGMSLLVSVHLKKAGPSVRPKRKKAKGVTSPVDESAQEVSIRGVLGELRIST
jgi:hypothetical protein